MSEFSKLLERRMSSVVTILSQLMVPPLPPYPLFTFAIEAPR